MFPSLRSQRFRGATEFIWFDTICDTYPGCIHHAGRLAIVVHMRNSVIISAFILLLSACSGGEEERKRPAALVEAKPVATVQFIDAIQAVGTAVANEQVVLAAPVTDRITSLNFDDGAFVNQGQVIAVLAQAQENAELSAALAREREAQQQLARISELKQRGFATNASLDTQMANANAARAQAGQVRAAIGDRVIRAPFSGWVSLRNISRGAVVSAGTEIATVSDVSQIKLDFTVPETQLARLQPGQPIEAVAAAFPDRPFRGRVSTIDPVLDPATRAVKVRAILPNPDRAIKPGMLLTVRVKAAERTSLAVPELSVVGDGAEQFVFIAGEDDKAKRVVVTTGIQQNGMIEILSGLTAGQKVVTEGVVKLSDGSAIRFADKKAGKTGGKSAAPSAR